MMSAIKDRNGALDVLRCFAMFLIVLWHAYHDGELYRTSAILDLFFGALIWWHVDAFLALSGWFGVRFKIDKLLKLWGLIFFYSCVNFVVGRVLLDSPVPFKVDGGWYGNTYLCLMLVAPFINAGIEHLVQRGKRTAWLAWAGFAAVIVLNWAFMGKSYVSFVAWDVHSFTLVQFVFIYLTMRLVRLTGVADAVRAWHVTAAALFYVTVVLLLGGVAYLFLRAEVGFAIHPSNIFMFNTEYVAPHVILMAIAMFFLFLKYLRFPVIVEKVCAFCAPSMFGVYLIHNVQSSCYGAAFHRVPLTYFKGWTGGGGIASACVCFVICLSIDLLRRGLFSAVKGLIRVFYKAQGFDKIFYEEMGVPSGK